MKLCKREKTALKLIDIQSMLARSYNYNKWDLIETKELEHKHLRSISFYQNYRDLLLKLYSQRLTKLGAVQLQFGSEITYTDVNQQLDLITLRENKENLTNTFKTNILTQIAAIKQAEALAKETSAAIENRGQNSEETSQSSQQDNAIPNEKSEEKEMMQKQLGSAANRQSKVINSLSDLSTEQIDFRQVRRPEQNSKMSACIGQLSVLVNCISDCQSSLRTMNFHQTL